VSDAHDPNPDYDFETRLDAMFEKKNEELWQRLRDQIEEEHKIDHVSAATGIADKHLVGEMMSELHVTGKNLAAITMYPLVYVAYADRVMNSEERKVIEKLADEWNMPVGSPSREVLLDWMDSGPSEKGFEIWKEYMQATLPKMPEKQRTEMHQSIMQRCKAVAAAVGPLFSNPTTKVEEKALQQVEEALEL